MRKDDDGDDDNDDYDKKRTSKEMINSNMISGGSGRWKVREFMDLVGMKPNLRVDSSRLCDI